MPQVCDAPEPAPILSCVKCEAICSARSCPAVLRSGLLCLSRAIVTAWAGAEGLSSAGASERARAKHSARPRCDTPAIRLRYACDIYGIIFTVGKRRWGDAILKSILTETRDEVPWQMTTENRILWDSLKFIYFLDHVLRQFRAQSSDSVHAGRWLAEPNRDETNTRVSDAGIHCMLRISQELENRAVAAR